jgi:hypothetical protein
MALETIDAALDGMPLAVVGPVELRRPTAPGPKLVPADRVRTRQTPARSPTPQPWDPNGLQDRFELRGVTPLPGRDQHRRRLLPLFDGEVDLRGQPASGTSETVIGRFDGKATRRLLLQLPLFDAPAACW